MKKNEAERIRELYKLLDHKINCGRLTAVEIKMAIIKYKIKVIALRASLHLKWFFLRFSTDEIQENKVFVLSVFDNGGSLIEGIYQSFDLAERDLNKLLKELKTKLQKRKRKYETSFMKNDENLYDEYTLLSFSSNLRTIEIRWIEIDKNYGKIKRGY